MICKMADIYVYVHTYICVHVLYVSVSDPMAYTIHCVYMCVCVHMYCMFAYMFVYYCEVTTQYLEYYTLPLVAITVQPEG